MGASEIIIIFLIYLILFGAKGIPSLAKTMGKAMYQFREARNDIQREIMDSAKEITSSAQEVRNEVENATKLAEEHVKKAQDTLENSVSIDPKSITFPKQPPASSGPQNPSQTES